MPTFVEDNNVLWLAVEKVGSPPAWQADTNYNIGDVVVPTSPQIGQENLAFQCVGFLGESSGSEPVFPATVGHTVDDKQIEWICQDPAQNPAALPPNTYYLINPTLN